MNEIFSPIVTIILKSFAKCSLSQNHVQNALFVSLFAVQSRYLMCMCTFKATKFQHLIILCLYMIPRSQIHKDKLAANNVQFCPNQLRNKSELIYSVI